MGAALSLQPSYYEALRRLTLELSGVSLGKDHQFLIETRLGALARREGFTSLSDMIDELFSRGQTRLAVNVVSALLQQEKAFFDDKAGFTALEDFLLGDLSKRFGQVTLQALVYGCGAGQDAYSLAMTIKAVQKTLPGFKMKILAVDYPSWGLDRAIAGRYTHFEVQRGLPIRQLVTHFSRQGEDWQVSESLSDMITFRDWHLMNGVDKLGQFHLILFRNALDHYSAPARLRLLRMLAPALHPEGTLMLGSQEKATEIMSSFAPETGVSGAFRRREMAKPEPEKVWHKDFKHLQAGSGKAGARK